MDFHDKRNQNSYSGRTADSKWLTTIAHQLPRKHIDTAADIGCGGGIYTRALAMIGIPHVIGIDSSAQMLADAKAACRDFQQIALKKGIVRTFLSQAGRLICFWQERSFTICQACSLFFKKRGGH
ncbi:class I SAM-dependent methyltransferase [Shouchella clausii]|uniref:class I SAM-dependent methyltransferase n=1 Tax=Shouchella clausii TaxID=79880 RepID=UPI0026FF7B38|nr:class I SAM-dependent methyltransferase [Shouchella clausii]MDO7267007.1 class I SAM-dependent methyltransferase [Shouchella clausii]MDO7286078.1 class I SAM-dependent methyltransferase [Shouchella clausii]